MYKLVLSWLLIFLVGLFSMGCGSKSTEVQISAPLRPKYVAKGYRKIYIADFIVTGEHEMDRDVNINVNKEIKETLRSEFKDKSGFEVESLKVEFDKSMKPVDILGNSSFWVSQAIEDKQGSMILAGSAEFSNYERSGLVTERVENPRTGDERNITSSRERLRLVLAVDLYLLDAQSGQKLFQENFKEEQVYDDVSNVSLPLFYDVFEKIAPKIVGVLVPYRVAGSRLLLEP